MSQHCEGCRGESRCRHATLLDCQTGEHPPCPGLQPSDVAAALIDLIKSAEAYMNYHAEKFYGGIAPGPTGLWPAITKARASLDAWTRQHGGSAKLGYEEPLAETRRQAGNDFAAGRISSGKFAELLGVEDIHAFKKACHYDCEYYEENGGSDGK